MKRINRKKLIVELEFLRQGFDAAILNSQKNKDKIAEISFGAYHKHADRLIVDLGGESIRESMTLHKTVKNIEWYKINKERYEGFNKKEECWEYTLDYDICGLWILRGQGKYATGKNADELMKLK